MDTIAEIERLVAKEGWTIEPDLSPEANEDVPAAIVINGQALRVRLEMEAQLVLENWMRDHRQELIDVLAPHGVHPDEILAHDFERIVRQDEVAVRA